MVGRVLAGSRAQGDVCGGGQRGIQESDSLGLDAVTQSGNPLANSAKLSAEWQRGKYTVGGMGGSSTMLEALWRKRV